MGTKDDLLNWGSNLVKKAETKIDNAEREFNEQAARVQAALNEEARALAEDLRRTAEQAENALRAKASAVEAGLREVKDTVTTKVENIKETATKTYEDAKASTIKTVDEVKADVMKKAEPVRKWLKEAKDTTVKSVEDAYDAAKFAKDVMGKIEGVQKTFEERRNQIDTLKIPENPNDAEMARFREEFASAQSAALAYANTVSPGSLTLTAQTPEELLANAQSSDSEIRRSAELDLEKIKYALDAQNKDVTMTQIDLLQAEVDKNMKNIEDFNKTLVGSASQMLFETTSSIFMEGTGGAYTHLAQDQVEQANRKMNERIAKVATITIPELDSEGRGALHTEAKFKEEFTRAQIMLENNPQLSNLKLSVDSAEALMILKQLDPNEANKELDKMKKLLENEARSKSIITTTQITDKQMQVATNVERGYENVRDTLELIVPGSTAGVYLGETGAMSTGGVTKEYGKQRGAKTGLVDFAESVQKYQDAKTPEEKEAALKSVRENGGKAFKEIGDVAIQTVADAAGAGHAAKAQKIARTEKFLAKSAEKLPAAEKAAIQLELKLLKAEMAAANDVSKAQKVQALVQKKAAIMGARKGVNEVSEMIKGNSGTAPGTPGTPEAPLDAATAKPEGKTGPETPGDAKSAPPVSVSDAKGPGNADVKQSANEKPSVTKQPEKDVKAFEAAKADLAKQAAKPRRMNIQAMRKNIEVISTFIDKQEKIQGPSPELSALKEQTAKIQEKIQPQTKARRSLRAMTGGRRDRTLAANITQLATSLEKLDTTGATVAGTGKTGPEPEVSLEAALQPIRDVVKNLGETFEKILSKDVLDAISKDGKKMAEKGLETLESSNIITGPKATKVVAQKQATNSV